MNITRKRLEKVIRPDIERIVALAHECLAQVCGCSLLLGLYQVFSVTTSTI